MGKQMLEMEVAHRMHVEEISKKPEQYKQTIKKLEDKIKHTDEMVSLMQL
jgi:hypothetical protein